MPTLTATGTFTIQPPTITLLASATLTAPAAFTAGGPVLLLAEEEPPTQALPVSVQEVTGMAAGLYDLTVEQGATCYRTFSFADDEDAPLAWDGWSARAQIRTDATEAAHLLLDLTEYLTVTGEQVVLNVPADTTERLHQSGRWDLEMVQTHTADGEEIAEADQVVVRVLQGRAQLSKEVTRL